MSAHLVVEVGAEVLSLVGMRVAEGVGDRVVAGGVAAQVPQSVQSVPVAQYLGSSHAPSLAYLQLSVVLLAGEAVELVGVGEATGTFVMGIEVETAARVGVRVVGGTAGYAPEQIVFATMKEASGL